MWNQVQQLNSNMRLMHKKVDSLGVARHEAELQSSCVLRAWDTVGDLRSRLRYGITFGQFELEIIRIVDQVAEASGNSKALQTLRERLTASHSGPTVDTSPGSALLAVKLEDEPKLSDDEDMQDTSGDSDARNSRNAQVTDDSTEAASEPPLAVPDMVLSAEPDFLSDDHVRRVSVLADIVQYLLQHAADRDGAETGEVAEPWWRHRLRELRARNSLLIQTIVKLRSDVEAAKADTVSARVRILPSTLPHDAC